MSLEKYTTKELKAEIKRRNLLKKAEAEKVLRCRHCKHMIEKAVEWLVLNMTDSTYLGANTLLSFRKTEFIKQFKKAMEE